MFTSELAQMQSLYFWKAFYIIEKKLWNNIEKNVFLESSWGKHKQLGAYEIYPGWYGQ